LLLEPNENMTRNSSEKATLKFITQQQQAGGPDVYAFKLIALLQRANLLSLCVSRYIFIYTQIIHRALIGTHYVVLLIWSRSLQLYAATAVGET